MSVRYQSTFLKSTVRNLKQLHSHHISEGPKLTVTKQQLLQGEFLN